MGHVEREIASPEAEPSRLVEVVAEMGSSTVPAPRMLAAPLLYRLNEVAEGHGGTVPLHGRLFAQWMHHAFPRECPFPHVSGTKNPQTPDEWIEERGDSSGHTPEWEMRRIVNDAHAAEAVNSTTLEPRELMWHSEEELLATHRAPVSASSIRSCVRSFAYLVGSVAAVSVILQMRSSSMSHQAPKWKLEKHMV